MTKLDPLFGAKRVASLSDKNRLTWFCRDKEVSLKCSTGKRIARCARECQPKCLVWDESGESHQSGETLRTVNFYLSEVEDDFRCAFIASPKPFADPNRL
jgi:hypothetical protein